MADLTGHIHIRQEVHLDFYQAVAGAGFAPAAFHVKAEPAGSVAPDLGIGSGGEQIPDVVEQPRIGCRVGSGGAADGTLVDVDDLVKKFQPLHAAAGSRAAPGMVQPGKQRLIEHLVHQAGLAGTGHAGNGGEGAQGDLRIHIFQVVFRCPPDRQNAAVAGAAGPGHRDFLFAGEVLSRKGFRAVQHILQRARHHNLSAVAARAGTHIHNVVRCPHGVLIMLHHNQGVADVPQMLQSGQELVIVPLVQTDGGLVQDVQHPHQ